MYLCEKNVEQTCGFVKQIYRGIYNRPTTKNSSEVKFKNLGCTEGNSMFSDA